MTTVYFVRHAEAEEADRDDYNRPLTDKGLADRALVSDFLADKGIDAAFSSPYKRAVDTITPFCEARGLDIATDPDFRERAIGENDDAGFVNFTKWQWEDFDNKLPAGDSLNEVQRRNLAALTRLLRAHPGQNIVVGTHGTALATLCQHYLPAFDHAAYADMAGRKPWIVRFTFVGEDVASVTAYDVFDRYRPTTYL